MTASLSQSLFVLRGLIAKDFKVRYRNMSLGIFWSLVNPIVMMGVLTFVFTVIMPNRQRYFPLFVLTGLLPFNFFSLAWATGTNSIIENASLVKKVRFERALLPISVVLANSLHYMIQLSLLLVGSAIVLGIHIHWLWLPLLVALQIVFACGMALLSSALDVYFRDMRYVVESSNLLLFWLVPIFYSFRDIGQEYAWIYQVNPIAAVTLMNRTVLLGGSAPNSVTLANMVVVSFATFAVGAFVFAKIEKNFSDYL